MIDSKTDDSTNKFKVSEVLRIDPRMWVDLQRIIVVCAVLEETVERIEHFVRQQEEEFSACILAFPSASRYNETNLERPP